MSAGESRAADLVSERRHARHRVSVFGILRSPHAAGLALAVAAAAAGAPAAAPAQEPPADSAAFTVEDVRIPARDGIHLNARVWRPLDAAPGPAILSITPYTADGNHADGRFLAAHGYVYVAVESRGRGASEGVFRPLEQDGPDAYDVAEWIVRQAWSDGRIGMMGSSYQGMVQWQTLRELPPALATIVPMESVYPGWDYPNPGGIPMSYAARWIGYVSSGAAQRSLFADNAYWHARFGELHREHRAFAELANYAITPATFERWLEHPHWDAFWAALSPGPEDHTRFDLPILTITGHFDGDQAGALKYYRDHMRHAAPAAAAKHFLVIGPWNHGGARSGRGEIGGLQLGEAGVIDVFELHRAWFDWVFHDAPRPELLKDRVAYYVMESDEWRYAPSLSAIGTETRRWYLAAGDSQGNDVFHSGVLAAGPPPRAGDVSYVYDPLVASTEQGGGPTVEWFVGPGAAFTAGPKTVFHSPALEHDFDLAGEMALDLWIELDVPDTDVAAFVYEIRADGATIFLGRSHLRARHRNGVDRIELARPGSIERYRFDRFNWTARTVQQGSRLRLVVLPLNSPHWDKNYNSGGNTVFETSRDARTATVRIHFGPEHPSALELPIDGSARVTDH